MKPTPPMPLIHGSTRADRHAGGDRRVDGVAALAQDRGADLGRPAVLGHDDALAAHRLLGESSLAVSATRSSTLLTLLGATVAGPDLATNPVRLQGGRAEERSDAGVTELNQIDLRALTTGNKRAWDAFVTAAAPLINAVVRRTLVVLSAERGGRHGCRPGRVRPALRQGLPAAEDLRSGPRRPRRPGWPWSSRSCAVDHARRRRQATQPLDEVPGSRPWGSRTGMSKSSRFPEGF